MFICDIGTRFEVVRYARLSLHIIFCFKHFQTFLINYILGFIFLRKGGGGGEEDADDGWRWHVKYSQENHALDIKV